ncbi:hypothetical protein O3P69_007105 [Scylla paramamosain]|uniref:Ubiquinol-cytochrome c chaperone domain-containing protein n=1 Tax=Scylla paramamosain TaxID=85552 RepID=A0AAW0V1C1_SCYPA
MLMSREEPGRIKNFIKKMGWLDHSKGKLKRTGFELYESACANIMTTDFFKVFDLPDTFYSWFLLVELHVWMLMVRLMAEGEEGRFARNAMLEAMWLDCETRSKKLGMSSLSIRQQQIQMLGSSFQATIFSYDEGLMTNDCVLASALWRRLFSKECSDPERLECCINFIRRQMAVLDGMTRDELLLETKVTWVPILEDAPGNSYTLLGEQAAQYESRQALQPVGDLIPCSIRLDIVLNEALSSAHYSTGVRHGQEQISVPLQRLRNSNTTRTEVNKWSSTRHAVLTRCLSHLPACCFCAEIW